MNLTRLRNTVCAWGLLPSLILLLCVALPTYAGGPIDANGNIINPALDPGGNTDTGSCDDIYYISQSGNDGNNCTSTGTACKSATKWKSLSVGPGDCVLYERGDTWNADPDWEDTPNGNSSADVTFGSYGTGARPKFNIPGTPSWNFNSKHHVRWDRLHIDGLEVWRTNTGSHHLDLWYVRSTNMNHVGFPVKSGSKGPPHHLEYVGLSIETTGLNDGVAEGIYVSDSADVAKRGGEDILIRDCYITGTGNEPINVKYNTFRVTVEGCLIEGNFRKDDPGMINFRLSDKSNAGHIIRNNVIRNNSNQKGGTYPVILLGKGTTAYNNIVHNNAGGTFIKGEDSSSHAYHNTCYQNGSNCNMSGGMPDANIKNNITSSSISGNISPSAGLFEDPANDVFRLDTGSSAIDLYSNCRGVTTDIEDNPRPIGSACDAGAFEYGTDPGDTEAPTAPSGFGATAVAPSQINLSWTLGTDNVAVTEQRIERCAGSGCSNFAQIQVVGPGVTSFQVFGLLPSTLYRFQVKAVDAAQNVSPASNIAQDTTLAQPPTDSAYVVVNPLTPTSVSVQTITDAALNGTTPTFALILMSNVVTPGVDSQGMQMGFGFTDGAQQYAIMCSAEDNQTATDNDCGSFNNYAIGIANYEGEPGSEVCAASFDGFVANGVKLSWEPACPAAYQMAVVMGSGVLANAFDITAPSPSGLLNNVGIGFAADVILGLKTREADFAGQFSFASALLNWVMASASGPLTMSSSVAWKNNEGVSIGSSYIDNDSAFICGNTKCIQGDPVADFIIEDYQANSVDVSFAEGDGDQYAFLALSNENDQFAIKMIQTPTTADAGNTSYNFGLQPSFAMCIMSATPTLLTVDETANAGTQGVFVTDFSTTLSLGYTHSIGDDIVQTGTLFNSGIELNDENGAQLYAGTPTATATGMDINFTNNPAQGNRWLCAAISSPDDPDTTPPTQPTNLSSTLITTNRIDMGWTASTDDVGVTHYEFESCPGSGCPGANWTRTISGGTTGSRTGLTSNAVYAFRVRAVDAAENVSVWSDVVNVRTLAQTPSGDAFYMVTSDAASMSTGLQTITNARLGGQIPSVAIMMMTGVTTFGIDIDGAQWGYGFSDGVKQYVLMCTAEHGQSVSDNDCGSFNDRMIGISDYSGSPGSQICSASIDGFVPDGIRINWLEACPSAYEIIVVLAANVEAAAFDIEMPAAPATVSASLSFEADIVFGMKSREPGFAGDFSSPSLVNNIFMTENKPTDMSLTLATAYQNGLSTMVASGRVDTNSHNQCGETHCSGSNRSNHTVTNFSPSGMDFVFTSTAGAGEFIPFLALEHGESDYTVQMIQTPATADAGATSYTLGYEPGFLMCVMSGMNTVDLDLDGDNEAGKQGVLVTDFVETFSFAHTYKDVVTTSNTGTQMNTDIELNDVDKTLLYEATVSAEGTGFNLNFSKNPAQQNYWMCLSVEKPAAAPGVAGGTGSSTFTGVTWD